VLETELGSEMENGRIVRLLTKLGFINERAEWVRSFLRLTAGLELICGRFEMDPRWSDTGDRWASSKRREAERLKIWTRYILKLFRDYVFHSIGVDGKPVLDLSHVLTCLNKVSIVV
jgi:PAB-dependent poly(A)-specific ribonuclease subunit 3